MVALVGGLAGPALADVTGQASGLSLPRFASLSADKVYVRVGPGQRYDVAFVYVRSGLPVEIIQEFDTWRKIRDHEGAQGWVHVSLLSGERTALVAPWLGEGTEPLLARPEGDAPVRAWATPLVLVSVDRCRTSWCEVSGAFVPRGQRSTQAFSGWIAQDKLWGVYPDENLK